MVVVDLVEAGVQVVVASAAQQGQIGDIGGSAGGPADDVVGLAEAGGAPAAQAAAVAGDQGVPLRR